MQLERQRQYPRRVGEEPRTLLGAPLRRQIQRDADDADEILLLVEDRCVRDVSEECRAVLATDLEGATPAFAAQKRLHDCLRFVLRRWSRRDTRNVSAHDLVRGPAIKLLGGAIPKTNKAAFVRRDHGVAERSEQLRMLLHRERCEGWRGCAQHALTLARRPSVCNGTLVARV